jgi:hypothetical protein
MMIAVGWSKHIRNNVIYILHALYVQEVDCLLIRSTVADWTESQNKHVNAFCWCDMEILNVKPRNTVKANECNV